MTDRPTVQNVLDRADRFANAHEGTSAQLAVRLGVLQGVLETMDAENLTPAEYVERYCAKGARS